MARRAKATKASSKPVASADDEAACLAEYRELMAESARVRQKIATMLKRYQGMGVVPADIKFAYNMEQKDDPAALHRARTATLARLGIITWDPDGQANFDRALNTNKPSAEASRKLELGRVRADGYNTGLAGGLDNCFHAAGSEDYVVWREGFALGHADRLARDPTAAHEKKADTRRSRRSLQTAANDIGDPVGSA